MAQTTFSTLRGRGDVWLDDADNFAFTAAAKDEMMRTAIDDDPFVFKVIEDRSLTTTALTSVYPVDDSYGDIIEVRIDQWGDGFGTPVSPDGWDFIDGNLIFKPSHKMMPAGKTLILRVVQKLYNYDVLDEMLAAYVLHMFAANCMRVLVSRKTGRFLRNQTTLAELMSAMQEHKNEALRLQRLLANRRDVRL